MTHRVTSPTSGVSHPCTCDRGVDHVGTMLPRRSFVQRYPTLTIAAVVVAYLVIAGMADWDSWAWALGGLLIVMWVSSLRDAA